MTVFIGINLVSAGVAPAKDLETIGRPSPRTAPDSQTPAVAFSKARLNPDDSFDRSGAAGGLDELNEEKRSNTPDFPRGLNFELTPSDQFGRWSLEAGAAFITENVVGEVFTGRLGRAKGDAAGWIYPLTASYRLHEFEWHIGARTFYPQLEARFTLVLVDERARDLFFSYNAGLSVRWVDFPWNDYVYTTFNTGLGLSYTEKVFAIERVRHPDRSRSHLRLYWPAQFTFAHPRYNRHQLVLLLHHQSGARIFQRGGMNAFGFGYRFVFPPS